MRGKNPGLQFASCGHHSCESFSTATTMQAHVSMAPAICSTGLGIAERVNGCCLNNPDLKENIDEQDRYLPMVRPW
jgi:hypothetical protein